MFFLGYITTNKTDFLFVYLLFYAPLKIFSPTLYTDTSPLPMKDSKI
jgi:hypothetical protein